MTAKEEQGVLDSLHDALLRKIEFVGKDSIMLCFAGETSGMFELSLNGVWRLRCDNLLLGNIVLDVAVMSLDQVSKNMVAHILDADPDSIHVQQVMEEVLAGKLIYIAISPSYGFELSCVCRDYSLTRTA